MPCHHLWPPKPASLCLTSTPARPPRSKDCLAPNKTNKGPHMDRGIEHTPHSTPYVLFVLRTHTAAGQTVAGKGSHSASIAISTCHLFGPGRQEKRQAVTFLAMLFSKICRSGNHMGCLRLQGTSSPAPASVLSTRVPTGYCPRLSCRSLSTSS